jgi:hypothetical protein
MPAARPERILAVYVIAFAVGTVSHVVDLLRGGLVPHKQHPLAFNVFWSSLTLFDPLAIVLLLRRQRAGLVLAGLIMVLDVAVNSAAGLREYFATGRFLMWGLLTQVPFAVPAGTTAPASGAVPRLRAPGTGDVGLQPRGAAIPDRQHLFRMPRPRSRSAAGWSAASACGSRCRGFPA